MNYKEYKCNICNKFYNSYKCLWNHNKKFHKNEIINVDICKSHKPSNIINEPSNVINELSNIINEPSNIIQESSNIIQESLNVIQESSNVIPESSNVIYEQINIINEPFNIINESSDVINDKKLIICEYCNKIFSSKSSKSDHKRKACKLNPNNSNYNELLELKKENEEMKKILNELKELFMNNLKIHPKKLQKINKDLINNNITNNNIINNTTINNNNNNNNNIINNTIINKTYVNFYDPINYKILTEKEILNIFNRPWKSLEESIKTIHFNKKFPEYNNIFITNRKDNTAYIFDGIKFCLVSKNDALNDLITSHMDEIESSATKYGERISENKLKHLNNFIETIEAKPRLLSQKICQSIFSDETINDNDKKFIHEALKKTFPNYRIYKCDLLKQLIYNNSDTKLLEKLKKIDLEEKKIIDND